MVPRATMVARGLCAHLRPLVALCVLLQVTEAFRSPFGAHMRSSMKMQRQAAISEPPTYASVIKDNPIEWFDNSMSYGVFNWGLNGVGDMQRTLRKVPVFPLNIVGSPGASRQLRIFEPRYRQMFTDLMSEKLPYNRTFGLVLTEGKALASVGCLMHVDVMQYENGRTDRFITFNRAIDRFRLVRLSTPTSEVPYIVADAEIGYEDIPLFQRMIPECDSLEAKVDWLVRDMLAYLIRWECKAIEKERMMSLEPLAARVLKYSAQNRAVLPNDLSEAKRRQLFVWSVVDLLSVGLQINELQLMLQLRDIHARLTILYEVTQRTHQYLVRGDSVLLDLMSTRLFRS